MDSSSSLGSTGSTNDAADVGARALTAGVGEDSPVAVQRSNVSSELEDSLRTAVRMELSGLDREFTDALELASDAGMSAQEVVERALARIRQRDAARIGRLGERVARARSEKRRIPSLSGTARFRVPDILTDTELIEVKNVARLALTPQLLDFVSYAEASGVVFVLLTRFDTVLAPDLAKLIQDGRIRHGALPGLLSARGRRVVRMLVAHALEATPDSRGTASSPEPH